MCVCRGGGGGGGGMRDGFMSDLGNVNGIRVQDLAKAEGSKTAQCMLCQIK